MIKVEALIRPQKLDEVKQALTNVGVKGMTITEVKGWDWQEGTAVHYRGVNYKVDLLPRMKLEVVVRDVEAHFIACLIASTARTGECGDGKIFCTSVEGAIRIRTGEEGEIAIA